MNPMVFYSLRADLGQHEVRDQYNNNILKYK